MKKVLVILAVAFSLSAFSDENLAAKIAKTCTNVTTNSFYGFPRVEFNFRGCRAWVVSPKVAAAKGLPWTWTMQWADAFVPRTPVLHLLNEGWHHVTIHTFDYHMNEKGLEISQAFQEFLVKELGFAAKARLVGMSWGGFFSIRYTNAFPQNVAAIYLDCPFLCFDCFQSCPLGSNPKFTNWSRPKEYANWSDDPRMPVNMAESVAKAGIPIFLLYGAKDKVCPPSYNCEPFMKRFQSAGGKLTVERRDKYGHHPHGLEPKDRRLADFFIQSL